MLVLWVAVAALVWAPCTAVTCKNGGVPVNSTSCNCTGTCFSGDTCDTHDTCGEVPTVSNSQWVWTTTTAGCDGVLTYSCDVGYSSNNSNSNNNNDNITVSCSGSSWSTPVSTCTRVSCPMPAAGHHARLLTNPRLHPDGYFYTDKVDSECRDFTRGQSGHIKRTCQADGTWSGKPLECQVSITSALVVGLLVALLCLALAVILPYDYVTYVRRQRRIKEARSHSHRIAQASMLTNPAQWTPCQVDENGDVVVQAKKRRASGNEPSLFVTKELQQQFYNRLAEANKMEKFPEGQEFSDIEDSDIGNRTSSVEMLVRPKGNGTDRELAYLSQESDDEFDETAH